MVEFQDRLNNLSEFVFFLLLLLCALLGHFVASF